MEFRFIEFNPIRAMRGARAANVEVIDGPRADLVWMSRRDVDLNIKEFGPHPELMKARNAYAGGAV